MDNTQSKGFKGFIGGTAFSNFILTVVFLNAITIGLQSYPAIETDYGDLFHVLDLVFLGVFTLEVIVKLFVLRTTYFKDNWNVFDFIVIVASIAFMNTPFVSVLRILRVLRVLKAISYIRSLRRIITSLFMAIPTIGSISLLMIIVLFIYGVVGFTFFAEISPVYFGNLTKSLITLFQIATFDDWANIYRPIAEAYPLAILYFVSFIFIAVFIMLNLVIGEIVNNATNLAIETHDTAGKADEKPDNVTSLSAVKEHKSEAAEIAQLRQEIAELKQLIMDERRDRLAKTR